MVQTDQPVRAEWIEELEIPAVVERGAPLLAAFPVVLVTCIDSHRRPSALRSLTSALGDLKIQWTSVDDAVALDTGALPRLVEDDNFFTGFDEVWFFSRTPENPPPEGLPITSELPIDRETALRLTPWMMGSGAQLGLGDGDGLNMVARDQAVIDALRGRDESRGEYRS